MQLDASGSQQMDAQVPPDAEATALAREIQHLVHSLPATTDDSRLIALLSNASFMNGSSLKSSIWNTLENISPTSSPTHVGSEIHPLVKGDEPTTASPSNIYPNQLSNESSGAFSDTSSIMVYSPLFPTQSDIVELAELVPYDPDSGEVEEQDVLINSGDGGDRVRTQEVVERASWTAMWPFSIWHRQDQPSVPQTLSSSQGSGGPQQQCATSSPQVGTNNVDANSPRIRSVKSRRNIRAWVPSSSKISIQSFWWGYRIYLPPPILEILSDKTLEAAKQAEMITTALAWLFNNLPIDVFPPHMKPFLVLLRLLIPRTTYIGSLISWSWSWIMAYDVGYGVTLTATWILPAPLIPGTWHEGDFPKSPMPNSPIPLPRSRPFSFEPPTPTMSTTTMTDDDIPTNAYATPMSSVISLRPLDENRVVGLSMASSSSTAWTASPPPPPPPPHLPISSPIHYPTTILPNSPNSLCFTPNSSTTTPVAHHFIHPLPSASASTSSVPFTHKPSTTLPSPRIRTPRFSTRMGSSTPFINSSNNIGINANNPPYLIIHNNTNPPSPIINTPISTSTPIPIPPTPIDLPPIPPELPLSPKLVNELLRGPVLQTVPLPDVE